MNKEIFDASTKAQLQNILTRLTKKAELTAYLGNNAVSNELSSYISGIKALSDLVAVKKVPLNTTQPYVEISTAERSKAPATFHMVPGGREFTAFIMAIYNIASDGQLMEASVLEAIAKINQPFHIQIFVSLSCELCRSLVIDSVRIASLSEYVTVDVYNIALFPELKNKYNIRGVPFTLINEQYRKFGKMTAIQLLEALNEVADMEEGAGCNKNGCELPFAFQNKDTLRLRVFSTILQVYHTIFYIHVKSGYYVNLAADTEDSYTYAGKIDPYFKKYVEQGVSPEYQQAMITFFDMAVVNRKITDGMIPTIEFVDSIAGWCRGTFLPAEYDEAGHVQDIIYTQIDINRAKKQEAQLQQKLNKVQKKVDSLKKDSLTHLLTRDSGEPSIRKALQLNQPGFLCILDCDHFKHYNDDYGHSAGDLVLKNVANALIKASSNDDIIMRFGGDEFMVFCPGMTTDHAISSFIERFFEELDRVDLPEINHEHICASVGGISFLSSKGKTFEDLYKEADEALYQSKEIEGNIFTMKVLSDHCDK